MEHKINKEVMENINKGKFYKKDLRATCKRLWKEFGCNTRGYKEIDIMGKQNNDGSIVFCHIGQWPEEKEQNTFDYDILVFDETGLLTYDEANGELPKHKCYEPYHNINKIKYYEQNY